MGEPVFVACAAAVHSVLLCWVYCTANLEKTLGANNLHFILCISLRSSG